MIVFNDTYLDYKAGTDFPLVTTKTLGDINALSSRGGTVSFTVSLPATPTNNKAFSSLWVDGAQAQLSGTARIEQDGLVYSSGKLFVTGFSRDGVPSEYKANYQGNEVDLIRTLETKNVRDLNLSTIVYSDTQIKANTGSSANFLSNGWCWGHPQILSVAAAGNVKAEDLGIFYSIPKLVKTIFLDNGVNYTAPFLDSDYLENKVIGTYEGIDSAYNVNDYTGGTISYATGASGTPPTLSQHLQPTTAGTGTTFATNGASGFVFTRTIGKLKCDVDIDVNFMDDVDYVTFGFRIRDTSANIKFVSDVATITSEGNYTYNLDLELSIVSTDYLEIIAKYYFKSGSTAPYTGATVDINSINLHSDSLTDGDEILLGEWLPKVSQKDFLVQFMKQFNCVMDVDSSGHVYLYPRNDCSVFKTANGNAFESIAGIMTGSNTPEVSSEQGVELVQSSTRYYKLKNEVNDTGLIQYKPIEPNMEFGSYLIDLGTTFNEGVTEFTNNWKLYISLIDYWLQTGTSSISTTITIATSWGKLYKGVSWHCWSV